MYASEIRDLHNIADSHYEKGLEEGRQQSIHDMATALKENGADLTLIRKVTGLSPEEIEEL